MLRYQKKRNLVFAPEIEKGYTMKPVSPTALPGTPNFSMEASTSTPDTKKLAGRQSISETKKMESHRYKAFEDETSDTNLQLNLTYNTQINLPQCSSVSFNNFDTGNSCYYFPLSNRSLNDMELVCYYTNKHRKHHSIRHMPISVGHAVPLFSKYIPIPAPVSPHGIPKLLINKRYPREWEDVQRMYMESGLDALSMSVSDTIIKMPENEKSSKETIKEKQVKEFLVSTETCAKREDQTDSSTKANTTISAGQISSRTMQQPKSSPALNQTPNREQNDQKMLTERFTLDGNMAFLAANNKLNPEFAVYLYVGLDEKQTPKMANLKLNKIQTDLALAAMVTFFHPYKNIHCCWVKDISSKVRSLLQDNTLKPKFDKVICMKHIEAVLVLSKDASALLRYKDCAFLHSLATALRLNESRILVLSRDYVSRLSVSRMRPVTA